MSNNVIRFWIGLFVIWMVILLTLCLSGCGTRYDTHKNDQKYWAEVAGAVN